MPWKSGTVMDSRLEFVRLVEQGDLSVAELCRRFGISRQTGHLYLRRYREAGAEGLEPRSSRPHVSPRRTPEAMETRILDLREAHPRWGGRKLARRLIDLGVTDVPRASTVTEVLRRHDKLDPTETARRLAPVRFEREAPNEMWQMDFKGHFALDRGRCHALTVLDDHSRYLIGLSACGDETRETVQARLIDLFRRHGLPERLLCDNGSPWGASGADSFTELEVWLLRCGVRMRHGRPYHPQTQGKDERFHRTLDVEVLQARRFADLVACQPAFDQFRRVYNEERPHEALDLAVPASRWRPSPVSFPEQLPEPEYYTTDRVRRVYDHGGVSLDGRRIKLSKAFKGLDVAFRQTPVDGVWDVFFMRFRIAEIDLRDPHAHGACVRRVSEHLSGTSPV